MTTIANALGIGSGIDTAALVSSLTAAVRDPKDKALTTRETANTAKVSALAQASSAIDNFATSLTTLISGGTLFTQPTSGDPSAISATALPGARLEGLSASIEVERLAQGQVSVSEPLASATTAVGLGTLNLTVGGKSLVVSINSTNNSLGGLAAAINAKKAGVTASVVTDSGGARLVLKGSTGAAAAFALTPSSADADLARFATDGSGTMTQKQEALDARLTVDGVAVTRGSNTVTDLIDGVQLNLLKTTTTPVAVGAERQTSSLKAGVEDFVAAYNELETMLDGITAKGSSTAAAGALAGDSSIRAMRQALARLVTTPLTSAGTGPKTLAEIGVATQRDGSLVVDTTKLDTLLASDPASVEALFNPGQSSDNPLVTVTSAYGKTAPGSYALADLVAAAGGASASGKIAGMTATAGGDTLTAAGTSPAKGLTVRVAGNVSSATITVDLGLGGALKSIRDALRADAGPLSGASGRLTAETKSIAAERTKLEARVAAYKAQLETSFTKMESRMSVLNATQTQLTNQIAQWNKSDS